YLTQKNWLYPWEIIPSNKKMTNIVYLDIYDINILQRLSDKKTHLVIGIDEVFLKALEACTSWQLYDINYTSCIEEQIIRNEQPVSTLSAIGLLKRILHMATRHQIFFLFKSYFETQNVNKRFLEKVFSQSATIRLQIDPYSHLNNLSHQLRCAFYEVIQM